MASADALSSFVSARRPDWERLAALLEALRRRRIDLDGLTALDRLYRRAATDLAHAQAAFPGSDVTRYLNQLCGRAHATLYRPRPPSWATVRRFFAVDFPEAVQATLGYTRFAAGLLLFGAALGALTVAVEPSMARRLLSDGVLDAIARRELWTDTALDAHAPSEMATAIFLNNLRVTFTAFAAGITLGIGTALLAVFNGLSLGATVTACFQHGLGPGIVDFITAHGPVELSVIAITCGGGLVIGHALISPGERPRGDFLRERARLAVRLVLGCAPFLVAIGVVEGFVSPGTFFPWPAKALVGVVSAAAFWRYLLRPTQERAASPDGSAERLTTARAPRAAS